MLVRLNVRTLKEIDVIAEKLDLKRAQVIRMILKEYVEAHKEGPKNG